MRACTLGQVERLLITPAFLTREEDSAEELIAGALEQGGDIELVSGEGARLLDESADGVAARLRFVLTTPTEAGVIASQRT
jgi:stalled ribosome rescue protein Dom34